MALLVAAGVAGGLVTAVVGGSSLITFPVLLATGLPPVIANASNQVALTPGGLFAVLADRERMPAWNRSLLGLVATAMAGTVSGAALLLVTPDKAFTALVPVLIGAATLLFAASERIRRWSLARTGPAASGAEWPRGAAVLVFFPVTMYGGYFGAGMSVMVLAILSAGFFDDPRTANVVKNFLSGLVSIVAAIVFVFQGVVAWGPALGMMVGAMAGGFAGGRLARALPPAVMRAVVIAVGAVLTVVYARRYWLA
jgi:uncharacterized membrane protein YfcA